MARQPQTFAGSQSVAQQAAPASDLSDDAETPTPEIPAKPEISAAEQIEALQAKIDALKAAALPAPQEDVPGSQVRPTRGPVHPGTGTPIFNAGRPTGRAG